MSACLRRIVSHSRRPTLRTFATSAFRSAALAEIRPQAQPSVLVASPEPSYIQDQELDVEILPADSIQVQITERAAERLRAVSTRENNPNAALRVSVDSGGCHGYQYKIELATSRQGDDYHIVHPSIKPSNILIDAISLTMLNGSTIDFATELIGSSFRIVDNPMAKGSGCGCGMSWELKE